MKKFLFLVCILLCIIISGETWYFTRSIQLPKPTPQPRPLLMYSFPNLKKTIIPPSTVQLGEKVSQDTNSFSQIFYYATPQKPGSSIMEKVSGLMNVPEKSGTYPVIVMFRGFVPSDKYSPGIGTEPVAKMLAQSGFITLAPDFLGFGTSSAGAADSFENRFQTYTTAVSLLNSLPTLQDAFNASYSATYTPDMSNIGIWGHSNGGHIALSTLEISGVNYPTVLWAPVSTSFPYSILYYTDESDDQGKALRKVLSQFESIYNTDVFSLTNYLSWIKAPMEIEQGTADHEVPVWWSDNLVGTLKKGKIDVSYNTYPGADHNMLPILDWNSAVENTIAFYKSQFEK